MTAGDGARRVLVVSGPSGSGKTSVAAALLRDRRFRRVVTATTRRPRDGEVDGRDYHFLSDAAFREGIATGRFLEHAEVYGRLYGTPRSEPERIVREGGVCVLVVDVQGVRSLRELDFEGFYVFVDAPDEAELRRRLESRGQDAPEVIERRLTEAARERESIDLFDAVIVNREVEDAARRLAAAAGWDWHPA